GHYILGRAVGIRVEIFSVGYGRGIWKKKIGDTTWQITAIPFGGYCKFYGDDYSTGEYKKGDFFYVRPLIRIIPVIGGPLFNLILAVFVFLTLHSLYGPQLPKVQLWEEQAEASPAFKAGLKNGDLVKSVNGEEVRDFYSMKQEIALSGGNPLTFLIERNGKEMEITVERPYVDPSGIALVGIRPSGKRYLEVNYPVSDYYLYKIYSLLGEVDVPASMGAIKYLNDGDVILTVQEESPHSITELQNILGRHHGKKVAIKVRRQTLPWLAPFFTEEIDLTVPSRGEFIVNFQNIIDEKYNVPVPDQSISSSIDMYQRGLSSIKIEGEPALSYEKLAERFPEKKRIQLKIQDHSYRADVEIRKIGLLGFRARDVFEKEYAEKHDSLLAVFTYTFKDTLNSILVYPQFFKKLFTGRMSLIDNARGPVAMFAMAGIVSKMGFYEYLQLMGAISIALMIMNLLPIPVVDGGHIMFFLYEAIAGKAVSPAVMEVISKFAFSILMFFGLFIMYKDVIFVLGM
ncbi:MAG: site-2 protease family protein, partial [Spirochaetia bacterium]|nr:site-2 protease family protein [Spirochaetia bacterium]